MAVSSSPYDTDRFGAALPRFSPRQADLLMVVGTVTHKQAPVLLQGLRADVRAEVGDGVRRLRDQRRLLPELRRRAGHRQDHSGGHLRPGLPAAPGDGDRRHHAAAGQDRPLAASDHHRRTSDGRADARSAAAAPGARPTDEVDAGRAACSSSSAAGDACSTPCAAQVRIRLRPACSTSPRSTGPQAPRFEVVYHFYSTQPLRARAPEDAACPEADPVVDSLVSLYGSAGFMERECHDMYGIVFRGNPDLRPILLYEGFVGHPLRKDYPKLRSSRSCPTAT